MKKSIQFLLVYFSFIVLAACDSPRNHRVRNADDGGGSESELQSFSQSQMQIKRQWVSGPFGNVKKASSLMVFVYDSSGELMSLPTGLDINFYATMPSMGHALEQPGYFTEISKGVYLNNGILLNMAGDWNMELWLQDANFEIKDKVQWAEFF